MDPVTAGMLAGGTQLGGVMLQNQASQQNSEAMMRFQEGMSSTAYQRAVGDMRLAGLNPALMFGSGAAASSPGGAQAPVASMGGAISSGIDSAVAMRAANKDQQVADKGLESADSQIGLNEAEAKNKSKMADYLTANTAAAAKDVEAKTIANKIANETMNDQIKKAHAEGDYARVNQMMGIIKAGTGSAADVKDLINPLSFLKGKK